MAEEEKRPSGQEPYVPASPAKRVLAWVGVAYMPLLVCPGAAGMAALCLLQLRQEAERPAWKTCALAGLTALCAVVALVALADGIPALLAGLGVGA